MTITVICVGKLKEKYWTAAVSEYSKRLSRFCRLQVIEVADEPAPEPVRAGDRERILSKEAERIRKKIPAGSHVTALAVDGKPFSSEEFSAWMDGLRVSGISSLTLLIGGSLGIHEDLLRESDMRLSFSRMTFPHQLMRVITLEQIYRAFKISSGEPYHK